MSKSPISEAEKKALVSLLEAKIERISGKKVTYVDPIQEEKKAEIKKIHEQLEKLTGKKVVFKNKQ